MKIKILASGSKGNCTYIDCENTKILLDVGINLKQIEDSLNTIDVTLKEMDAVLISHTHSDHIKGLATLVRKVGLKVYITIDLLKDIRKIIPIENIVIIDNKFNINDVSITLINTSHDVKSYGFIIEYNGKSLVHITDTGYINRKYYDITSNKDIYVIEANHDEEMLMNGPYPYILKQRVIGDVGHLSNRHTGKYLATAIGNNTKYIFLAHISENNNTKELALHDVKEELKDTEFDINNIILTSQNESSIEVEV